MGTTTAAEMSVRALLRAYNTRLESHPYSTNVGSAAFLGFVGDILCQKVIEGQPAIDWPRHRAFVTFAAVYQGAACGFVYGLYARYLPPLLNRSYAALFRGGPGAAGSSNSPATRTSPLRQPIPPTPAPKVSPIAFGAASTLTDNFVHSPLSYIPCYYLATGLQQGQSLSDIRGAMRESYWDTVRACWGFWVPMQFLNFAVVPQRARVLFVNCGCLFWNIV